jgi:hypothetical protein
MRRFISKLTKTFRPTKARAARRRPSLHVEALESRQLLSGSPLLHLPLPILDPIELKYLSLGGAGGVMGKSISGEMATPYGGGLYEKFQNGAIFYSPSTGAHDVFLATENEYFATAFEKDAGGIVVEKLLGLPTTDQVNDPYVLGACMTTFQGGKIYWSPWTGAHDVYGLIGAEYAATAFQKDAGGRVVQTVLGLPTSDEMNVPGVAGGRMNTFQGGAIYWSPTTGAHDVYGLIGAKYNSMGGAKVLGLPTTDETPTPDGAGRYNHFETIGKGGGALAAIDWTPWTGAHAVTGAIASEFAALGWEKVGEAVTDQITIANFTYLGAYNRFETILPVGLPFLPYIVTSRFAIDWTKATGAYKTHGTQYTDVVQGGAPTCWLDASVAALEKSGEDLSDLIHYQGNNWYTVSLYAFNDPNSHAAGMHADTEWVYFDGGMYGADMQWNPSDPAASWTVIMQRGVLQALGIPITSPPGGDPANALSVMTGRTTTGVGVNDPNLQTKIESALASGKAVALCTIPSGTKTLVSWHCYAVLSASNAGLTLYNPWGSPVSVSWAVVAQDVAGFAIC